MANDDRRLARETDLESMLASPVGKAQLLDLYAQALEMPDDVDPPDVPVDDMIRLILGKEFGDSGSTSF